MAEAAKPSDMAKNTRGLLIYWGLPVAAMVAAIWLDHPLKTIVWLAALVWMGGCLPEKCWQLPAHSLLFHRPVLFDHNDAGVFAWFWLL